MDTKKVFDWEHCAKEHRPERVALLKELHNKEVSLEEYMSRVAALGLVRTPPSKTKREYNNLKDEFGFFV